jgi:xanthine/CO dehydrogenase XdhC/CoxF family maturation factor
MKRETLLALNEARGEGRAVVRAVELSSGEEQLIDPAGDWSGLGIAAAKAARADQSTSVEIDGRLWFLTVYNPPLDLAIVGAVHIAKVDDPALSAALRSTCFYIGALGSKKTHVGRRERLRQHGFSDAELDRIHGPIGLAIGARSPSEIAVAILAQMTQVLRTE